MKTTRVGGLCLLAGALAARLLWGVEPRRSAGGKSAPDLALVGCLVYPSPEEAPIRNGVVVVRQGRVAAVGARDKVKIPRGATRVDCAGRPLFAGFWNSHVHFTQNRWLDAATVAPAELESHLREMLLRYGYTNVFDTGSYLRLTNVIRRRINSGEVAGPAILTAGELIFPKGGGPKPEVFRVLDLIPGEMPEVQTAEEARKAVREHVQQGADGIKLYLVSWFARPMVAMPPEAVAAAVQEGHALGKLVLGHPTNQQGLELGLSNGVDIFVHTTPDGPPWDNALIARMKTQRVAVIPTLKLWLYETRDRLREVSEGFAASGVAQLRAYAAAGGQVLFGTDVGYMTDYDPTDEYVLMARAGMNFRQILASLTTAPSERFADAARPGRIAAGMDADLVMLSADPAGDVKAFASVRLVVRRGRIVYDASAGH